MENKQEWLAPYLSTIEEQFNLTDEARKDVDALFSKIGALAEECADQGDFSTKFLQSALYTEYTGLFTKYQSLIRMADGKSVTEATKDFDKQRESDKTKGLVTSIAGQKVNEVVSHMLPDEVNRIRWAGARALPIIGPIIQWIDNFKWLTGKFEK